VARELPGTGLRLAWQSPTFAAAGGSTKDQKKNEVEYTCPICQQNACPNPTRSCCTGPAATTQAIEIMQAAACLLAPTRRSAGPPSFPGQAKAG
jgi:hypothetical protein